VAVAEPPGAAPALAVAALSAGYGRSGAGRAVLEAISFEVGRGELVGVLGPNGAGKSTLVRAISGVLPRYDGSVRVLGDEVRALAPRELARRLAVVPQEPRFELPFTALEIVLLGRHPHLSGLAFESADDVAIARRALARVDAAALADRAIDELSAGERQRVVFARALAQEAPLLLLDEPASFLDLRHEVELFDRLRELAASGRAVVAVLHDLNLAAEYCDRLLLLKSGRVAAFGATGDVLTYANLKAVYETEVYVDLNDLTGRLVVTALSSRARAALERR
jgi:iron complex transport system ATP-binding protein